MWFQARFQALLHDVGHPPADPVGFGHRTLVDGLLARAAVSLEVSFESADLATIEGLLAAGLGVAILPEQMAGQSGRQIA